MSPKWLLAAKFMLYVAHFVQYCGKQCDKNTIVHIFGRLSCNSNFSHCFSQLTKQLFSPLTKKRCFSPLSKKKVVFTHFKKINILTPFKTILNTPYKKSFFITPDKTVIMTPDIEGAFLTPFIGRQFFASDKKSVFDI